jgi:quercetin dioxygenase-like cupin family protein
VRDQRVLMKTSADGGTRLKPFDEAFPSGNVHHHFIGQEHKRGVYAKELHIPAGYELVSHSHKYDHLSILASGTIMLTVGDAPGGLLIGPRAITIAAGVAHSVQALSDAVWFCIHPHDETDPATVDEIILKGI